MSLTPEQLGRIAEAVIRYQIYGPPTRMARIQRWVARVRRFFRGAQ